MLVAHMVTRMMNEEQSAEVEAEATLVADMGTGSVGEEAGVGSVTSSARRRRPYRQHSYFKPAMLNDAVDHAKVPIRVCALSRALAFQTQLLEA
jgi:hypothetical protein